MACPIPLRRTGFGGTRGRCALIKCRLFRRLALAAVLALPGLFPPGVAAVQELYLQAGPAEGHGWSVESLESRLRFNARGGLSVSVEAGGLKLPAPLDTVRAFRARCEDAGVTKRGVDCRRGIIELTNAPGLPAFEPASFEFEYGEDRFRLKIDGLRVADGELRIDVHAIGKHWSLSVDARAIPLAAVLALAGDRLPASLPVVSTGTVTGSVRWAADPDAGSLSAEVAIAALGFSDVAGLNVGENLGLALSIDASRREGPWRFAFSAALSEGQAYFHPVFVDATGSAISLTAQGHIEEGSGDLLIGHFEGGQDGVVSVSGSARLIERNGSLRPAVLNADARVVGMKDFYEVYLAPWLIGTALAGAEFGGGLDASLSWRADGPSSASLRLQDFSIDDADARYGAIGVNGVVHWRDQNSEHESRLAWKGAHIYRIDVGGGELVGRFESDRFELEEPVLFPMLNGVLAVDSLAAEGLGSAEASWRFNGRLTPISLAELTNRLAWPPFSGTVSGVIPSVRYADGNITVDGTLSMEAFDGSVRISDLKLSQLFGVVPRATANISLSNLSLDALTRTFSFGNIQGRLDGRIDNLVLENWRPAEFDAEFATPEDDSSRHRISQRAVDNLASLGGAGHVLSSTALRFLESFSYDRLGIKCRLRNGICVMDGVERAERGYYIVKGGGIPPRIDVLGFNNRVDWNKLVQRLKAARVDQAVIR